MKTFTRKNILQKTIIVILSVLLINFIVPTYSHADANSIGGVILSPLVDLVCSLGDVVVNLLQKCMKGEWGTGAESASFNMFLVEDDEFWSGGYSDIKTGEEGEFIDTETFDKGWLGLSDKYHIPVATYSPEQIFAGNVSGLDINFINPKTFEVGESSAAKLQGAIATWYVALRNLATVGLLSVLVYVGIRIILSSSAADKAKYKQMFTDWLIALCLLFFLHYIMSFIITLTESICTSIGGDGETSIVMTTSQGSFKTNLLGSARFKTQYKNATQKVTYLIFYIALVIYTVLFTWTYLKRMLMMAFLTLIAPLVALTYPIDKMNDGKAQAFDAWLKEYAFNALIQPFHLIIYIVFVGTAMDLVESNMLYAIAALGFILPAEKILRGLFGFNKAGTLDALKGFTAASVLNKFKGSGGNKDGKGGNAANTKNDAGDKTPRFENKHDVSDIDGGALPEGNDSTIRNENEADNQENANQNRLDEEAEKQQLKDYFNNADNNDAYMNPQEHQAKLERLNQLENPNANKNTNGQSENKQEADKTKEKGKIRQGISNLSRHHNITPKNVAKGFGRGIKGVAKLGTKAAFTAGAGTIGAAIGLASGQGLAGVAAGVSLGSRFGNDIGNRATQLPGAVARGGKNVRDAVRRERDVFNGNTNLQDKVTLKEVKKDENNLKYLSDMMTKENGGRVPSAREVKEKMGTLDPYISEGLTDIKDMLKAQKAESYVKDPKQAAVIAALAKEKGIDKDVLSDDKKYNAQLKNFTQEFKNKKGVSEDVAKQMADRTLNVMKVQNGVAHNLEKIKSEPKSETKLKPSK